MDSIKNLNDFKQYVHKSNLKNEDVVFDILGFVIANKSHRMFDYLVNQSLSAEMKETIKETLESSGDGVYKEWVGEIKFSSAQTSLDLTGDTSIDDDPVEKAFESDPLDKLVDDVLGSEDDKKTAKSITVATYSFAPDYDSFYTGGGGGGDSSSDGSSSDDDFVKELEKSLNI